MLTFLVVIDGGIIYPGSFDWVTKGVQDLCCQDEAETIGTDERETKSDSNMH